MTEHDPLQSVEQARNHLAALRTRLELEGQTPESPEFTSSLGVLLETLEKLQASYGLLREVLARTSDAVFAKDGDGRYVMINREGAWMFGKSVEEILGQDDTALFERKSAEQLMAIDRGVMSTGEPQTSEGSFDIRGVPTTLLTTKSAWYEPRGQLSGLIGTTQNVTEQRRVDRGAAVQQDRLRSLASEIVIAEEGLRQSLAADLQNGIGQDIALARMNLSALRSSSSPELGDSLTRIEDIVENADRSLRSITYQLSPPSLHDLGLLPALEWLGEDIGRRYGIDVRIENKVTPAVADDGMRVILYRAVRELLTNIATHAGAREALVRLEPEGSSLRITVKDHGAGFDPAGVGPDGHGLFGIREQLHYVGGSMHIDSVAGAGTTVVLTAPLSTADAGSRSPAQRSKDAHSGRGARSHVCDATVHKHTEQEVSRYRERVRSLMADLLLTEEHERRRLAVDLHDGLSQTIALARIKLSALRASTRGKLANSLEEIEELIEQADRSARSISVELSPPALHELGLEPAVQWLVENIQTRYGIDIVLEDDGQPKPADEKTRVILFRSIRELLINAAKHAGARRVHVRLGCAAGQLNAAVEDDGVGMQPDLASVRGSGLFSIHERLSHVGGSMRIESAPGAGTRIQLCAPLATGEHSQGRLEP